MYTHVDVALNFCIKFFNLSKFFSPSKFLVFKILQSLKNFNLYIRTVHVMMGDWCKVIFHEI